MISVDLGTRTTKAVLLEQRGEGLALTRYALLDAPIYEKSLPPDVLADHLKSVCETLQPHTKLVTLAIGVQDALVRQVELPPIPVDDMRFALKNNTRGYLQQDLPNYVFDCHILPHKPSNTPAGPGKSAGLPKVRVLIGGAKKQLIDDLQTAIKSVGLVDDCIVPGLVGPLNAFERAMPEVFAKESVALVDIGFKNSSICLLHEGELVMNRVVGIGGDKLTAGLAESMNITYAEAEGIKVGMAPEVQSVLETQLLPLGRELRASLDFFEHQQDRTVSQVFISGGSAQSDFILQLLRGELMVECKAWNPTAFLELALPEGQAPEVESIAPQLAVAVGAALTLV